MPDPTTPERQDLRERIAQALVRYDWEHCLTANGEPGKHQRGRADAVLAVLVEPPGDLREQMAAAMRTAFKQWINPESETNAPEVGEHFAVVAASVRWEDAARRIAAAEARADEAEQAIARGLALCDDYATHHPDWRPLATQTAVVFRRALTGEGDKKWLEGLASVAAERDRLAGEVAELQNERDLLREALGESDLGAQVLAQWEAIAAADADRDRLEAQVAALQRDLAEAKRDHKMTAEYVGKQLGFNQALPAATSIGCAMALGEELAEAKRALHTAQITHIREAGHDRPVVGDCEVCRVLTAISRDMPSRPDDPEEIRRLAQATTEEKPGINAPVPDRIDYDDEDELDDVVVNNCDAHLERMSAGRWYLGLYGDDGRILQITIGSKTGRAEVIGVVTCEEGFEATTEETNDEA